MDNKYIAREYASGQSLADAFIKAPSQIIQVRIFKEVAKENDYCILGFCDGLSSDD